MQIKFTFYLKDALLTNAIDSVFVLFNCLLIMCLCVLKVK